VSILLVEDDPSVRLAVHRVLTRFGCTVHDAENGRQATEALEQLGGTVDLVLTDLVMPEMGGVEFANVLKERWPRTRILFMSGYTAEAIQRQSLLDAGTWFIEKPFTSEALIAKVREVLEPGQASGGVVAA
jgi:two-component system cell cycle sensor histidine kinase/response regulator CckA